MILIFSTREEAESCLIAFHKAWRRATMKVFGRCEFHVISED